jgi:hypothetical protein
MCVLLPCAAAWSACVQNPSAPQAPPPAPVAAAGSQFPGGGLNPAQTMIGAQIRCFYGGTKTTPAATILHTLEVLQGLNVVHLRLTLDPDFVDNTYGATTIGWSGTRHGSHVWKDLVGSDHAQLTLLDGAGATALDFKLDYISADATTPSGYRSLGVTGGDGRMLTGNASAVMQWSSSMDKNLNDRGYGSYVVDSPATDAKYTPNAATPDWDYRVVYEAWVKLSAFGSAGFGSAKLSFIHASPSKLPTNTVYVVEHDCPHDWVDETCGSGGCTRPIDPVLLEGGGGACAQGTDCLSGKCSAQGLCETSDSGGPCRVPGDCGSGACSSGMCEVGTLGGTGSKCTVDGACLSEHCVAGTCGASASGFPCQATADCGAGLSCLSSYCSSGIN